MHGGYQKPLKYPTPIAGELKGRYGCVTNVRLTDFLHLIDHPVIHVFFPGASCQRKTLDTIFKRIANLRAYLKMTGWQTLSGLYIKCIVSVLGQRVHRINNPEGSCKDTICVCLCVCVYVCTAVEINREEPLTHVNLQLKLKSHFGRWWMAWSFTL